MDESQRLRELFDRYVKRNLPPVEVAEMVTLLERADAEDILSEPMRRVWEELRNRQKDHKVDWDKMLRQVSEVDMDLPAFTGRSDKMWLRDGMLNQGDRGPRGTGRRPTMPVGTRFLDVWAWRAVAAMFLTLAGVAAYWSVKWRPAAGPVSAARGGTAVAAVKSSVTPGVAVHSWLTKENKKVIHLPDGSVVILNRHSRMDYKDREVSLSGEAYFDIVHRPGEPFVVHAGKIVTRVLGTAFDIRAYSADRSVEVTVDHGRVQVLRGTASLGLLSDKEQIRVDADAESYRSRLADLKPVMAWKPEEINFDDVTMEEATKRIGQRFKMNMVFVNPMLKSCRITATFYMEDDLDQIMEVICGVNQSTYVIKGNTVTIDGKGCN